MGTSLSRLRLALDAVRQTVAVYEELNRRVQQSPGIPVPGPSTPYWAMPPAPIAQHGADSEAIPLPEYADVVIIGSGISGAAIARTMLGLCSKPDSEGGLPQIVMLEARDACSGATGRNGGHITPPLFHDYLRIKEEVGVDMAKAIIRFRLAHLAELLRVAEEDEILEDSQCREVDTCRNSAGVWRIVDKEECIKDLQFSQKVVGAIATSAGVIHPYRFVTGILSRLLAKYPTNFRLFTHTPCLKISSGASNKRQEPFYTVLTSRGTIRARHVVHATNGWVSHLLPAMRGKIAPIRGHMTAQRPGTGLGRTHASEVGPRDSTLTLAATGAADSWLGTRSFVMIGNGRYDYLTQQPSQSSSSSSSLYPIPAGELMLGGGLARAELAEGAFVREVGNADDRDYDMDTGAYLGGALSMYFGGWGAEGRDLESKRRADEDSEEGRVKKLWTGVMGVSADGRPWVGRLSAKMSARATPRAKKIRATTYSADKPGHGYPLAPPGEWICAGYSGEGMVHAYLCAKALAHMICGKEEAGAGLPDALLVSDARWKKANLEDLVKGFVVE
ncbi:FAD-dependent protein [Mycena sanguinolenta]|uniref:FAD-dependent protein n=1 Tax=Mycena sanguinolenta TaxID=230812 RepID=A0A8H7DGI8_9AGAR|nr:FAD-dependent protein [Mycena sanguinolenta]